MRTSLRRRSAALAAVSALALAGCGASSTEPSAAHSTGGGDAMRIVTSTSVYASLARQVAPEGASVESIVSSAAQDPHSYEASARDKLTLSKADVVVLNGGGYDDFAVRIVDSLPKKPRVVTAVEASETEAGHAHDEHDAHDHGEEAHDHGHEHDEEHGTAGPGDAEGHEGHDHSHGNEHVWYDVHTMQKLVGDLRSTLSEADPGQAGVIDQRAAALDASLADLAERTHELATKAKGKRYLMTEPLPQALLDELGMKDLTPAGLSAAVEEGNEIPPLQMDAALELVQQKKIEVLFFNAQTEDTQTSRLRDAAKKAGIPVVQVRETLEDDQDYQQYMGAALDDIAGALK